MSAKKVLVVDDEAGIREMLRLALEISEFECLEAADIHEAYRLIMDESPDMVLLDWMLSGGSGIELLRRLKKDEATQTLPVIMLTAKTHEDNVVQGLEVGADDYITKPFAPKELIARMKAILRRSSSEEAGSELRVGELVLEIDSRRVMLSEKALEMGPTEFKLLHFFMSHPERAYSRAQLLDRVWGANVYVEERTVDVHIRRLRKALQAGDPIYADLIQTVRGTGYRFSPRDLAVA
jgi:two-component system phosphate regulon response regulator PhoB